MKHSDLQQTTDRCLRRQETTVGWAEIRATWNKQLLLVFPWLLTQSWGNTTISSLKGTETSPRACRAHRLRTACKRLSGKQGWPSRHIPGVLPFKMDSRISTASWLHHCCLRRPEHLSPGLCCAAAVSPRRLGFSFAEPSFLHYKQDMYRVE